MFRNSNLKRHIFTAVTAGGLFCQAAPWVNAQAPVPVPEAKVPAAYAIPKTAAPFTPPPLQPSLGDFVTGLPLSYSTKVMFTPKLLRPGFAGQPTDTPKGLASFIKANQLDANKRIKAIKFLAKQDCITWKESQVVMREAMLNDPVEDVRYHATIGLRDQLAHAATEKPKGKDCRRYDLCRGCCNIDVMKDLAKVAYDVDDYACPVEPSERIRQVAAEALNYCCNPADGSVAAPPAPPPGTPAQAPALEEMEENPLINPAPPAVIQPGVPPRRGPLETTDPAIAPPRKGPAETTEPVEPPSRPSKKPAEAEQGGTPPAPPAPKPAEGSQPSGTETPTVIPKQAPPPAPKPAGKKPSESSAIPAPLSAPQTKAPVQPTPVPSVTETQVVPARPAAPARPGTASLDDPHQSPISKASAETSAILTSTTVTPQEVPKQEATKTSPTPYLNGRCVVSLLRDHNVVDGKAEVFSIYDGNCYRFATAAEKQEFDSHPENYAAVNHGYDIVKTVTFQKNVKGYMPFTYENRIYMFQDREALKEFRDNPEFWISRLPH